MFAQSLVFSYSTHQPLALQSLPDESPVKIATEIVLSQTLQFFDLSNMDGVIELTRQQDSTSEAIDLPGMGILFGDKFFKKAYVSAVFAC